ncbi:DNase I-like protein [Serendipita vermifera]|nr:DNase I-like protein [Serendipita vermifera]
MATHDETSKGSLRKGSLKLRKPILSLDHSPTSRTPRAAAQTSVFARLQAHFLPHVSSPPPTTSPAPVETNYPPPPKYIKIRIMTWNMNGTLPKGDLAALLGTLPQYQESSVKLNDTEIPGLSLDTDHPYHIVLVAGQECPTLMGLPMGLGGGMKWDWDKEDDDKRKSRPDRTEEKKKKEKMREKDERPSPPDTSTTPTAMGARTPSRHHHHFVNGWSNILEDYFSRGIGTIEGVKPNILSPSGSSSFTSLPQLGSPDRPQAASTSESIPSMADKNVQWKIPPGETMVPKIGPYELLTKERLAGIYLALYIHRDITHLVEGYSQSSVAAGLIGGRLGNKGGVAISLKLNGTTFLFLNAHLAAHEERNAQRLLNMSKIKSELELNDFLPMDDKRKQEQDLTDRFDHTFLCGDLNFRLEMTRIHAEWLISRKEYAKAQEWDQLRKIMKSLGTNVFTGFQEPPIDFPPTFKYDVLRTLKGSKRVRKDARARGKILSEVEEVTQLETDSLAMDINPKENASAIAEDDDSSSTSSASISMQSRSAVDNDDEASLNGSDAGAKNGGSNITSYPDLGKTTKHAVHVARRRCFLLRRYHTKQSLHQLSAIRVLLALHRPRRRYLSPRSNQEILRQPHF